MLMLMLGTLIILFMVGVAALAAAPALLIYLMAQRSIKNEGVLINEI